MTELARGVEDRKLIYVGDQVMIKAEVLRSAQGVGAQVRLFSKTDEMQIWVAESHLSYVLRDDDLPAEPKDGTWILVYNSDGNPLIFHRDDAQGHSDRHLRRHDRHWFDVVNQEWIDWPAAVARGATRPDARRMTVLPVTDELRAVRDQPEGALPARPAPQPDASMQASTPAECAPRTMSPMTVSAGATEGNHD